MDQYYIELGKVNTPRYLRLDQGDFSLEVYTGCVGLEFEGFSSLAKFKVRTFVPVSSNELRFYRRRSDLIESTAIASPAAFDIKEDEANLVAVDRVAEIELRPQSFPEFEDAQWCLTITAEIGLVHAKLISFAYQVTLKTFNFPEVKRAVDPAMRPS